MSGRTTPTTSRPGRGILEVVSTRRVRWSLVVLAVLCLVPVAGGVALLFAGGSETSQIAGWGLVGFFGSGVVVLSRKALSPR